METIQLTMTTIVDSSFEGEKNEIFNFQLEKNV